MEKLLQAKSEIQAEIDAIRSVPVADRVAARVAEFAAQLTAELEATDAEQLAELEIGLKFIDRAIARAEADIPAVPVEIVAEEVAVEAVAVEEVPAV
jgi:hypothetical protein